MFTYFKKLSYTVSIGLGLTLLMSSYGYAEAWKFGIISDTQWTHVKDDGYNPHTVPAGIIKQIDKEFIRERVKFVVAVGDTVDVSDANSLETRALYAQDLYNGGIGFYPLRGNHEAKWPPSADEFEYLYPQIRNGLNNKTPFFPVGIGTDTHVAPDPRSGSIFTIGTNFSSPELICNGTSKPGLSYSFDYQNARMILIDQWDGTGNTMNSTIYRQQKWLTNRLSDTSRPQHVFVFGHKNLLGGHHKDNLFGNHVCGDPGDADPCQQPEQDAFISAMAKNNARFYISGHDHHHYHSIVKSPLSSASVHQMIAASDSSKFYDPAPPFSDNDTPISQDLYKIGYYIFSIDGPRLTVNYYGVPVDVDPNGDISTTPTLTSRWKKIETFGYSLNGKEFLVAHEQSYNCVQDSIAAGSGFIGTKMRILYGINQSKAKTNYGKSLTKAVNTGWTATQDANCIFKSDILSMWGISGTGQDTADSYVVAVSFSPAGLTRKQLSDGAVFLAGKAPDGKWRNTIETNHSGSKKFVYGAYNSGCSLGSYGIDPADNTVWAVVDHDGDFAVILKE